MHKLFRGRGHTAPGVLFSRCFSTSRGSHAEATQTSEARSFEEIPGPRGFLLSLPIIGHAFLWKPFTEYSPTRPDLMAADLHKKYGKIVRIPSVFGPSVLLSDPADMLTLFHNEGKYPSRPNFDIISFYMESRKLKTLSTMNGEEWFHLRKRVQPKFMRPSAADPYVPAIDLVASDLATYAGRIASDSDEDFYNVIFMYVMESLGQFCFNRRIGGLTSSGIDETNETASRVKSLFGILGAPPSIPLYRLYKTKTYKTVEENMDYLIGLSRKELEQALHSIDQKKDENQPWPHFVESLMAGSDLTDEEIAMSVSEFFFGGTDTTSRMLALLVYHIAINPEKQDLLYEEIRNTVGQGPVTRQALTTMNFTKACVKESLRLVFPLSLGAPRYLPYDLILANYKCPKGTLIFLSNAVYLHDPVCVEDPLAFKPERWIRGQDRKKNESIPNVAFLPFGIGSRMCLGKRFAEQIIYLGLIKLVQNYKLTLWDDPGTINIKYSVFPNIDKPLKIEFTPRQNT